MRYLELQTNDNTSIEIHNDWTGKEKVLFNGEIVSEKRSFFGHKHTFTVEELGFQVNYEVNVFMQLMTGVGFEIKRNGTIIMSNKVRRTSGSEGSMWAIAMLIASLVGGFGVGYGIVSQNYYLLLPAVGIFGLVFLAKSIALKFTNSSKC